MPVFISYRHTDRALASAINTQLKQHKITTYFDVEDLESRTCDDITAVITRNITECTHLIAVVSHHTALSWWVPFEIGEATISDRRICTYQVGREELPLYLEKWPKMSSAPELELFVEEYRRETSTRSILGLESLDRSTASNRPARQSADHFHKALKQRIQRGY
jgi:hypothetical protein